MNCCVVINFFGRATAVCYRPSVQWIWNRKCLTKCFRAQPFRTVSELELVQKAEDEKKTGRISFSLCLCAKCLSVKAPVGGEITPRDKGVTSNFSKNIIGWFIESCNNRNTYKRYHKHIPTLNSYLGLPVGTEITTKAHDVRNGNEILGLQNRSGYIYITSRVKCETLMNQVRSLKRLRWSRGRVLASSTQVRGLKPGRSRRIFQGEKNPQQ
jgi:hypothetical protein